MTTLAKRTPEIRYSDFAADFTPHPLTGDISRKTEGEAIKRAVRNILLTERYERFFRPLFGSDITAQLFENITPFQMAELESSIMTAIINFEPRVRVTEVKVTPYPESNAFLANIVFVILNTQETSVLDVLLDRVR